MSGHILIVDDEKLTRETLGLRLQDEDFQVWTAANPYTALEILAREDIDVIVTDLRMPSMDGLQFQKQVRERWRDVEIVFITAFGTISTAVEAMQSGAADYLTKPLNSDELVLRIRRLVERQRERDEMRRLRMDAARCRTLGNLVYRSSVMTAVVERAVAVADSDVTVLIEGETGTGKEVLAHLIHDNSARAGGPFVAVNCAGLNPNLIESELFGHEAGSFTGATRQRKGRLELADGGSLLIDEVDDLDLDVQVRLLRFLQERCFERVGSSRPIQCDVRVLCATKHSLPQLIEAGRFREDLYYRLNTVSIDLPPLRSRREDIIPLAEHFARGLSEGRESSPPATISSEALDMLRAYRWPGNVRELMHAIEHAVVFARDTPIEPAHLPRSVVSEERAAVVDLRLAGLNSVPFADVMADCERRLIEWALAEAGGNQVRAAARLEIPRTTLRSRLAALREQAAVDDAKTDSEEA